MRAPETLPQQAALTISSPSQVSQAAETFSLPQARGLYSQCHRGEGGGLPGAPAPCLPPRPLGTSAGPSPLQGLTSDFLPVQPASRKPRPGERVPGTLGPPPTSDWAPDTHCPVGSFEVRPVRMASAGRPQKLWSINNTAPSLASLVWPIAFQATGVSGEAALFGVPAQPGALATGVLTLSLRASLSRRDKGA